MVCFQYNCFTTSSWLSLYFKVHQLYEYIYALPPSHTAPTTHGGHHSPSRASCALEQPLPTAYLTLGSVNVSIPISEVVPPSSCPVSPAEGSRGRTLLHIILAERGRGLGPLALTLNPTKRIPSCFHTKMYQSDLVTL